MHDCKDCENSLYCKCCKQLYKRTYLKQKYKKKKTDREMKSNKFLFLHSSCNIEEKKTNNNNDKVKNKTFVCHVCLYTRKCHYLLLCPYFSFATVWAVFSFLLCCTWGANQLHMNMHKSNCVFDQFNVHSS